MCKQIIVGELRRLFGFPENFDFSCLKSILVGLGLYGTLMLITFSIAAGFTAVSFISLSVMFGFLLLLEAYVLFSAIGFLTLLITVYYVTFFIRKGWERPLN